jgi:hypothetical protein
MGDLRLVQFDNNYDGRKMRTMVDILENTFNNISAIFARVKKAPYVIYASTSQVGNVGAGEDNLITYSFPANTLKTDGYHLEIVAWGTLAANANNKTIKMYFGSTVIFDTGAAAANNGVWSITARVIRAGASAEEAISNFITSNTTYTNTASYTTATETLSSNITIKCTGTGNSDNDIVQNGLIIKVVPYIL